MVVKLIQKCLRCGGNVVHFTGGKSCINCGKEVD